MPSAGKRKEVVEVLFVSSFNGKALQVRFAVQLSVLKQGTANQF